MFSLSELRPNHKEPINTHYFIPSHFTWDDAKRTEACLFTNWNYKKLPAILRLQAVVKPESQQRMTDEIGSYLKSCDHFIKIMQLIIEILT